jgi:hypothetical protein
MRTMGARTERILRESVKRRFSGAFIAEAEESPLLMPLPWNDW